MRDEALLTQAKEALEAAIASYVPSKALWQTSLTTERTNHPAESDRIESNRVESSRVESRAEVWVTHQPLQEVDDQPTGQ